LQKLVTEALVYMNMWLHNFLPRTVLPLNDMGSLKLIRK